MNPLLSKSKAWAHLYWPLIFVIILSLFVRITLQSGVITGDNVYSYQMAQDSWQLADTLRKHAFEDGFLQSLIAIRGSQGLLRIFFNLPLTLIYAVFGFSQLASISYSLVASAVNIILIFSISRRMFNERSGFIAALIWAFLPLDVLFSGTVSLATPLLTIALLACLLMTVAFTRKRWSYLVLVILPTLLVSINDLQLGISLSLILGSISIWFISQNYAPIFRRFSRFGIYGLALMTFILTSVLLAKTNTRANFSTIVQIIQSPGTFLHLTFFLISVSVVYKRQPDRALSVMVWFLSAVIGLGITISSQTASNFPQFGGNLLFAFVPLVIIEGVYFSELFETKSLAWFPVIFAAISLLTFGIILGDHVLLPDYSRIALNNSDLLSMIAEIGAGFAIILAICTSAMLSAKRQVRKSAASFLLVLFLFAMIPAVWNLISPYQKAFRAAEEGIRAIQGQPVELPVYFVLNDELDLYSFAQGLDQNSNHLILKKDLEGIDQIEDGYIVVPEEDLSSVPDSWVMLSNTEYRYKGDVIYRALSQPAITNEIESSTLLVSQAPSEENLTRLFLAEMNAGNYCVAVDAWMQGKATGDGYPDMILINDGIDCFVNQIEKTKTLFETHSLEHLALTRIITTTDSELFSPVWSANQVEFLYPDPRTFSFTVEIQPDSFYLYTGLFRAREEATVLYWQLDNEEGFASRTRIPSWTPFAVLIYTGGSHSDSTISLLPTLIDNYGIVYLSEIKFLEIPLKQN